ncbi:XdhC family protein [Hylemonella gracilis]|uniref:XdhC family protein n=1 Tax=Hylemonella gracilis TaxID=80880 RepID=A0A4P6UKH9_9BURK|nr:XdhC family protein [Hylemonella gracilis]QBK04630.1 XdhC family protein [Hylemonella gracilis]
MDSLDLRVLADALAWRRAGHAVSLVTVVQTWGSAPRPPGALLAVRGDGQVSGSVSGGCVEDDLIVRAKAALAAGVAMAGAATRPELIVYGVDQDEAARFGLPCGGTLRLVHEPLQSVDWIEDVLTRTAAHQLVARTLDLATGAVTLAPAVRGQELVFDGRQLTTLFGPRWRLLLIGAGQLSQAVAPMAALLDFEVLVCDPREEYAGSFDGAAAQRLQGMPDDVVRELMPDAHTAIVALTHDPKLDDMALLEALKSAAFYVGALGSKRNQGTRKQRLAEHFDLSADELARLHGPVGLDLGARTPAEIAVSILAEIVQVRNAAYLRARREAVVTSDTAPDLVVGARAGIAASTCVVAR